MSENLKPTLLSKLKTAQVQLQNSKILTARLDAQVLLGFVIQKNRAWILANADYILDAKTSRKFDELIKSRSEHLPIAYLTGKKEFYGREFTINSDVLIPRPETEILVEITKDTLKSGDILDVGTGSGAIAVTLALEEANFAIDACDISEPALQIAQANAKNLNANVEFFKSDLLNSLYKKYDLIIANLPYVDRSWHTSPELKFEPQVALYADDSGLALIKKLLDQAPNHLKTKGLVLLEADPRQHQAISIYSDKFKTILQKDFAILLQLQG